LQAILSFGPAQAGVALFDEHRQLLRGVDQVLPAQAARRHLVAETVRGEGRAVSLPRGVAPSEVATGDIDRRIMPKVACS
jgi:hypothetical protein